MTTSEGDISRENLKRHGIIYDEDFHAYDRQDENVFDQSRSRLPGHVDALREALLPFSKIIPDDWKEAFDDEYKHYGNKNLEEKDCLRPLAAAYFTLRKYDLRTPSQRPLAYDETIEHCKKIAEGARNRSHEAESKWARFLQNSIFRDFDHENSSRTKTDYLFDEWSLQEDVLWNAFPDKQETLPDVTKRTAPKPDLTYGFPITRSPEALLKGFGKDEYIQSFSPKVLKKLHESDLHSAITTGLQKWTGAKDDAKLKNPDLLCYPWAVVEMKHSMASSADIERCYCQAANASAAALSLQEQLLARASGAIPNKLPPVIAFTCIGPRVKVWLTYRWKRIEGKTFIKMSCIWSTSLELTWGVMATRDIVQSMLIWSSRILKPKIAVAVGYVTEKLDNNVPLTMRSPGDEKRLLVSTPPATPSPSRNRPRRHSRSPSVLTRQASRLRTDESVTVVNSSAESSGTEAEGNKKEDGSSEDNDDASDEAEGNGDDTANEQLEEKRRSALRFLPGVKFAKSDVIDQWFEGLSSKQKVEVVQKLIDPSNGGLLRSSSAKRLKKLLKTLNEALDDDNSGSAALTLTNFSEKNSRSRIRRSLNNLEPRALKICFSRCLRLHNDETHRIYDIIADDLKSLSADDLEDMEQEAFESLNSGDDQ